MKSFVLALASVALASYSDSEAMVSVQLSQDAYCGKEKYMTHTYEGAAKGF